MSNILDKPTESIFGYISVLRSSLSSHHLPHADDSSRSWSLLCVSVHCAEERRARNGSSRFLFQGRDAGRLRGGRLRTSLFFSMLFES